MNHVRILTNKLLLNKALKTKKNQRHQDDLNALQEEQLNTNSQQRIEEISVEVI